MSDREMARLARLIATQQVQIDGLMRTQQVARTVVGGVPVEDRLAQAADSADRVASQGDDIARLDDGTGLDAWEAAQRITTADDYLDDFSQRQEEASDALVGLDAWRDERAEAEDFDVVEIEGLRADAEQNERDLEEAREALEEARVELGERLDGAETALTEGAAAQSSLSEKITEVEASAAEALELAPLTAGELTAVAATLLEAWIKSAHIEDLDVGKLVVTGETVMAEAVIEKLFAEVISAKIVQITDELLAKDGTFTGRLTVEHLDLVTMFGARIDGLQIYGGKFVQYATADYLPIYPSPPSHVEVGDWSGGAPASIVAAVSDTSVVESGAQSARVARTGAGSVSAVWFNRDRVAVQADAARRVEVRFRSSVALTGVHLVVGQAAVTLGSVPANTWTSIAVDVPEGAHVEWAHLGGIATAAATVWIDRVTVLSAALLGAHMRIDRDNAGIPGLYGYNAASEQLVAVTPNEIRSTVPATGEYAQLKNGGVTATGPSNFAGPTELSGGVIPTEVTNWDDIKRAGFFWGTNAANGPKSGWLAGTVTEHAGGARYLQELREANAITHAVAWRRYWNGTTWTAWTSDAQAASDTAWATVSIPGGTGTCRWRRLAGIIYLEFDVTYTTAVPAGGAKAPGFTLPAAARPAVNTPLTIIGSGSREATGYIEASSGNSAIKNSSTVAKEQFFGSGLWAAAS